MEAITSDELLRWNETTAAHWRTVLIAKPQALALPCDIRGGSTVADLLQHIVGAELRYAQRLCNEPVTEYEEIPKDTAAALFAAHELAMVKLRSLFADPVYPWEEELDMKTRSEGSLIATRRVVFTHALLHSIRHYAQLATLLRHQGIIADGPMDFLFLTARFG